MVDTAPILFIVALFCAGYALIISESFFQINKATTALLLGTLLWTILAHTLTFDPVLLSLKSHFLSICEFLFFLMGAMIIVEIMNTHHALDVMSPLFFVTSKRLRFWLIGLVTFFLSSILDNLTTTIVMVSLLHRICPDPGERKITGASIVIAANCGGAWTPIGDVTTTMLWIGGQVTTIALMQSLFVPSMASFIGSTLLLSFAVSGNAEKPQHPMKGHITWKSVAMLVLGFGAFIFVPTFKIITGLPPYVGMLLATSVMGMISELFRSVVSDTKLHFHTICSRIDNATLLFFIGILLSVDALEAAGILHRVAGSLHTFFPGEREIPFVVGIISAIIDNVPLVRACMGMYSLEQFAPDSDFWNLLAYAGGVGGNLLIIGSAAGIAFMGMERVSFAWYLKKVTFSAFVGYIIGYGVYFLFV